MSLGANFRFLALAACLPGMAVLAGCATGGGAWDQPYEGREDPPEVNPYLDFMQEWNSAWEEAYGLGPGELMGPFWIEPEGPPKNEAVYLGPYFEEAASEEPPAPYQTIILQVSMSGLEGDSPPGFLTGSLYLCGTIEEAPSSTVFLLGIYYADGRDAWGRSRPEGMGAITEMGFDLGLRGYLLSGTSGEGLFVTMGVRVGGMDWSYSAPTGDGDLEGTGSYAGSGTITAATVYAGLGMPLVRLGPFSLGMNATLGYRGQEVKNQGQLVRDLFPQNQMEFKLDLEASIPF